MRKHKQEDVSDWIEEAREFAKAERELQIERWVYITIEYRSEDFRRIVLFQYDLPRENYERRRWVIRWRQARCQCLHPRDTVQICHSYYDKRTGLRTDYNSCLSKLAASKAQITLAKKKEQEYLAYQKQNNLFFDESTDENLVKFREKLNRKEESCSLLYQTIQDAVREHNSNKRLILSTIDSHLI